MSKANRKRNKLISFLIFVLAILFYVVLASISSSCTSSVGANTFVSCPCRVVSIRETIDPDVPNYEIQIVGTNGAWLSFRTPYKHQVGDTIR